MTYRPPLAFNYRHPLRTTPLQPQNLPRPTTKGCGGPCGCAPCGETATYGRPYVWRGFGTLGLMGLGTNGDTTVTGERVQVPVIYQVLGAGIGAALAYHGYKRNDSVGWALVWFFVGGLFWPLGLGVAFAQGFGKRAR